MLKLGWIISLFCYLPVELTVEHMKTGLIKAITVLGEIILTEIIIASDGKGR